jgi:hypothetical protein
MLDYREKRAFPRMNVDCPAKIRLHGDASARGAIVKNLSGGGVLIWLDQPMEQGRVFDITVEPGTDLTPSLDARVKVTRCTRLAQGEGSFAIACQIEQLLS